MNIFRTLRKVTNKMFKNSTNLAYHSKKLKIFKINFFVFFILISAFTSGCVHKHLENIEKLNQQAFSMKNRIDEIEKDLKTTVKGTQAESYKSIANINNRISKLEKEQRKIIGTEEKLTKVIGKSLIDKTLQEQQSILEQHLALKKRVSDLNDGLVNTLSELDKSQKEQIKKLVEAALSENAKEIEEFKEQVMSKLKPSTSQKKLASLKQARNAFQQRRYLKLKNEIPQLIPKMKLATSVEELGFYYAESLFKLGELSKSAIEFSDYLKTNPKDLYFKKSTLRLGDIYRLFADKETAKIYYEELIRQFSKSEEAKIAANHLKKLN